MSRLIYATRTGNPNHAAMVRIMLAAPMATPIRPCCTCGYDRPVGTTCGEPCL